MNATHTHSWVPYFLDFGHWGMFRNNKFVYGGIWQYGCEVAVVRTVVCVECGKMKDLPKYGS
jgi:hypothetical protein